MTRALFAKLNKSPLEAHIMVHGLTTVFDRHGIPIVHVNFKTLDVERLNYTKSEDFWIFEKIFVRHSGL